MLLRKAGWFTGSDTQQADAFGFALAYSGGTLVVGPPFAVSFHGEAYVFTHSGTTWAQKTIFTGPTTRGSAYS